MQNLIIRGEIASDYPIITEVNDLAFAGSKEGRLVNLLRRMQELLSKTHLL